MKQLLYITIAGATGFMLGIGAMLKNGYPLPGTRRALIDSVKEPKPNTEQALAAVKRPMPARYIISYSTPPLYVDKILFYPTRHHLFWMRGTSVKENAIHFSYKPLADALVNYCNRYAYHPFSVEPYEPSKPQQ